MSLSDKQKEYLLNCNHRWNIKIGATGSGKSWLDYAYVIPRRLMCMRGEGAAVIMGNTQGTAERNILDPMREIYGADLVGTISNNRANLFGRKVWVLGADNKKHVARIQGMTIEYAYGDEMTTWAEPVFQMLKSRLRCKHSYFDGTANPDSPSHYIKQFIDTAPDIFYQTSTIFDNPFLPKEFVENLCQEYAGTVYYKRYINGEWSQAEGLIYPNFEQVFESPPSNWQSRAEKFVLSIDYGTLNAFAALLWAKIDGVWYGVDGYYYSGRTEQRNKTDDDYVQDMLSQFGAYGNEWTKLRVIVDPSAASFITAMKRAHIFHVVSADNAVNDGIRETAVAIQKGKIKINPSLDFIKREFEGYVWNDYEEPVKENDHAMDSMRYFVKTMKIVPKDR